MRLIALTILYALIQFHACAGEVIDPKSVPALKAIDVHELHLTKTAQIGLLRFDMIDNANVGTESYREDCHKPYTLSFGAWELLSENKEMGIVRGGFNVDSLQRIFATQMQKSGYPEYAPDLSLFATRLGSDADFRIGVTVTSVQFAFCAGPIGRKLVNGRSYVEAKFEVFSQREQKVVLSKTVEASYESPDVKFVEEREFNRNLLVRLTNNLLSDQEFAAIFR